MPEWQEIGPVKRQGKVTLNASGNGDIYFDVFTAWSRWIVETVVVSVSGSQPGVFPQCVLYVGPGGASQGLSEGATWNGGQETFRGKIVLDATETLTIEFTGGTPGAVATAILEGVNYLWR